MPKKIVKIGKYKENQKERIVWAGRKLLGFKHRTRFFIRKNKNWYQLDESKEIAQIDFLGDMR